MENQKVTSQALRDMPYGVNTSFALPRHEPLLSRAANSGRSLAYRLQRELQCTFKIVTDFENSKLYITKLKIS
ncbi:MAG: hypothetical protein K2J42_08620 [Muribaculaceae bacterium]|nr:hypothetical protein [Muribaculaceae bacterium]